MLRYFMRDAMKAIIALSIVGLCCFHSYAQDFVFANSADEALNACKEKVAASPEALQQKMLDYCNCVVGKTDFEKASQLKKANQSDELQKLHQDAGKQCDSK